MPEVMQLFVLAQPETFEWPVKVPVPLSGADAGKYGYATFVATFPNLDEDAVNEIIKPDEQGVRITDREMADRVLLGARDLRLPDGTTINYEPGAFTALAKAQLLGAPRVYRAVVSAFFVAVRGLAAEGN